MPRFASVSTSQPEFPDRLLALCRAWFQAGSLLPTGVPPMKPALRKSCAPILGTAFVLMVAGCSQNSGTPAPTAAQRQAQAQNADAARNLETYRQLLRIHNDQMAVSIGQEIVSQ
ncbi:MAG TPA: hypothetical protein VMV87_17750, partial [Burkholderiales bacterium]|nr:hypothetical protein [Burkholderiales bacterium]